MEKAKVFEETYRHYLSQIADIDYLARAEPLGAAVDGDALMIPLYDREYAVSADGIEGLAGSERQQAHDAVRVMLAKYVLMCPEEPVEESDRWVTYRDFRDAAPLVSYFTTNTNKTIENQFSGNLRALEQRCRELGGGPEDNESFDLCFRFKALPRIPVKLQFNDADDMFPAACKVLYPESVKYYLDMECLSMTGTLLAGKLLKQRAGNAT